MAPRQLRLRRLAPETRLGVVELHSEHPLAGAELGQGDGQEAVVHAEIDADLIGHGRRRRRAQRLKAVRFLLGDLVLVVDPVRAIGPIQDVEVLAARNEDGAGVVGDRLPGPVRPADVAAPEQVARFAVEQDDAARVGLHDDLRRVLRGAAGDDLHAE